jgi:putative endopeptidase
LGKYTNKAFRDIEFQYDKVVSGIEEPKPLWEDCVDTVNNRLLFAVGKLYIDENFSEEGKIDLNDNIDLLEEAFKQLLNGNEWMKEETKKEALNKVFVQTFNFFLEIIEYFFTAPKNVESYRLSGFYNHR